MKVKIGVRCEYWHRPEYEVIDMPDGSTQEEIDEVAREIAFEVSKIDWWIEEQSVEVKP